MYKRLWKGERKGENGMILFSQKYKKWLKIRQGFHFLYPEGIAEEKRNRQVPVYPVN